MSATPAIDVEGLAAARRRAIGGEVRFVRARPAMLAVVAAAAGVLASGLHRRRAR